jgi:hypothetical protein
LYKILTGKQRGLVFPVMCNGHLKIDYSDNVPNSTYDLGYGLFSHEDSFTLETVLTPFDVNGDGQATATEEFNGKDRPSEIVDATCDYTTSARTIIDMDSTAKLKVGMRVVNATDFAEETFISQITSATRITISRDSVTSSNRTNARVYFVNPASQKVMPSPPTVSLSAGSSITQTNYQSSRYLTNAARISHEMMIFSSNGLSLSLLNNTNTNVNQPAEYKLKVAITIGTTTTTLTSNNIITANSGRQFFYNDASDKVGFDSNGLLQYKKIATFDNFNGSDAHSPLVNQISTNGTKKVSVGEVVYVKDGFDFVSLGRVTAVNASSLGVTDGSHTASISSTTTDLYLPIERDAAYINQQFHIGCSFNASNKSINLFLNGKKLKLFDSGGSQTNAISGTGTFSFGASDIYIGATGGSVGAGSSTTNKQFMGVLHELSVVNKPRKSFSIRNLLPNYDDTLLYLRFEEIDI